MIATQQSISISFNLQAGKMGKYFVDDRGLIGERGVQLLINNEIINPFSLLHITIVLF